MPSTTITCQDFVPMVSNPAFLYEGLGSSANFLSRDVPKRRNPGFQPGTEPKLYTTLIVQMLAKTGPGGAQDILAGNQEDLLVFCEGILALPEPIAALEAVVNVLKSKNPPSIFSVSPPTVSAHLDRFPVAESNAILREQLAAMKADLEARRLWPGEIMLTADPTDTPYRGRFYNQWTNWGREGNQPTYKRVFKEFGIFAMPVHLQIGFAPFPVNSKGDRELPAWVRNIGFAVAWLSETGTRVPLVAVDREFYSAVGFGAAYLGELAPSVTAEDQPRLLCPTKLWHSKRDRKWEFLAGEGGADVTEDSMEISARDARRLGDAAMRLTMGDHGKRQVPVAVIAAFDTYSKKKTPKSLDWAREEGARTSKELKAAQKAQAAANKAYKDYTRDVLGNERAPQQGKGKKRKKFKDKEEKARYRACVDARAAVARWEGKKSNLKKRLVFFTASLREGEHVAGREAEFRGLVRQYREHWAIENGFKSQKGDFRVRTNCRKTTARHARAILGAFHYNAWHFRRLCQAAQEARKSDPAWQPFDTTIPPLRKRYEREFRPALSARAYLLDELKRSKQVCIETFISQFLSI